MVVKSLRVRAPGYAGCSGSASMRGCWKGEVTAREVGHDGQGKKFNGASQTNFYGDDAQAATNYPIVRITNISTGHVFYCRTHDHSTMAVGYNGPTYTQVDIPSNMETGASYLEVVVNGIASPHYMVGVH